MPTPFHVHFTMPEDAEVMYPMIPDGGTDMETATAKVNPQITVEVNMPAIVAPLFVEGASPIGLVPGDQWPFAYVTWEALQSMVVDTGVQFAVTPVEIGANQVPIPIGDAALVTCGPFECAEGMDAPDIMMSSAACDAWDPGFELEIGLVDNDRMTHASQRTKYVVGVEDVTLFDSTATYPAPPAEGEADNTSDPFFTQTADGVTTHSFNPNYEADTTATTCTSGQLEMDADGVKTTQVKNSDGSPAGIVVKCLDLRPTTIFDGLDLGWRYSSSLDFKVTHDLGSVNSGPRPSTTKAKSRSTPLSIASIGVVDLRSDPTDIDDTSTGDLIQSGFPRYAALAAEADASFVDRTTFSGTDARGACETVEDYDRTGQSRPKECFRLTVDGRLRQNYLDPYSFTADPQGADVAWGAIAWEAFEELTCDSYEMSVADSVKVCSMLEAEVENLPMPKADPVVSAEQALIGFNLTYAGIGGPGEHFRALWYDHPGGRVNPNGNLYDQNHRINPGDPTSTSDYNPYEAPTASSPASSDKHVQTVAMVATDGQSPPVRKSDAADIEKETWVKTLLRTFPNPDYGDLGKTDFNGNSFPDNHGNDTDTSDDTCSGDDGGTAQTGRAPGSKAHAAGDGNSTLCDAADVEISTSVTFVDGMDLGCSTTVEYTLTCQWDASGGHTASAATEFTEASASSFLSCKVSSD